MAKSEPGKPSVKKVSAKKAAPKAAAKTPEGNSGEQPANSNQTKARTVTVVVLGMLVVVGILVLNAGGLAKLGVEKIASRTLGVKVAINELDVQLEELQVDVSGITVANPEGYQAVNAITMDSIHLAADKIAQKELVFSQIRVSGTQINLEVADNKTNLMSLHGNLDAKASSEGEGGAAPVKMAIHELLIEDAILNPAFTLSGTPMEPVVLPDIRITGIGEGPEGALLPSEVVTLITDRLVIVAMRAAVEKNYLQGMDQQSLLQIQEALGFPTGFAEQMRDLGEKVKGLFKN